MYKSTSHIRFCHMLSKRCKTYSYIYIHTCEKQKLPNIALLSSRRLCKDIGPVKAVWWMGVTPMTHDWQKSSGNIQALSKTKCFSCDDFAPWGLYRGFSGTTSGANVLAVQIPCGHFLSKVSSKGVRWFLYWELFWWSRSNSRNSFRFALTGFPRIFMTAVSVPCAKHIRVKWQLGQQGQLTQPGHRQLKGWGQLQQQQRG